MNIPSKNHSPEAILFLSHVHQRHQAEFNHLGLPARYPNQSESELGQLQTLAGAVDISWLGLMLHQTQPDGGQPCTTVPEQWPDGFFRHTVPEGRWIEFGSNQPIDPKSQPLPACLLQLLGPEWLEILDNLWIEPHEREALIELSENISHVNITPRALASHLVGIPIVYVANNVIPVGHSQQVHNNVPGCGLLVSHDHAEVLWETLMSAGLSMGLNPVGVDARQAFYESFSG
jgi:hypothetical protein